MYDRQMLMILWIRTKTIQMLEILQKVSRHKWRCQFIHNKMATTQGEHIVFGLFLAEKLR